MTVAPMLMRVLRYGVVLAFAVAVVGGAVGWLLADFPGLIGGVLGAVLAALFLGLTAVSLLIAGRVSGGQLVSAAFFGIVLGGWMLKLIIFLLLAMWLRSQEWIDPGIFAVTAIVAVLGSLVVDVLAFQGSRLPYVSDVELPGTPATAGETAGETAARAEATPTATTPTGTAAGDGAADPQGEDPTRSGH